MAAQRVAISSENQISRGETPTSSRHHFGSLGFKPHLGQHYGIIGCNLQIVTVPMLRQYHITEHAEVLLLCLWRIQ